MKKTLFLIILLTYSISAFAQDVIIKTNGKTIHCKVLEVDYSEVYYYLNNDLFKHSIRRSEVREIQYGNQFTNSSKDGVQFDQIEPKNSVTIGILEGGGSLVGFDYEFLVTKSAGIQAGAGIIGFGASLNIHLKPTIRSTFIALQYWHQGFGTSFTQSLLGPSIVFRAKKIFTGQIGFGFALEKGPAWPERETQPPIMLTYAIGIYLPF
jgi:hypothetical protein